MFGIPFRCGIEAVLYLIGGKWKFLVLYYASRQRLRFSELQRLVGDVSEKMLSQQLKEMVADGLLRRIDHNTVPPHVEYEATPFGLELSTAIRPICEWGTRNMDDVAVIARARITRKAANGSRTAVHDTTRGSQA